MARLNLLVLRCRDLDRSRQFYAALGFELTAEKHGGGPIHYSIALGSTVLELYPTSAASSNVRLGLEVRDVGAAVEAIRALGGSVERELVTGQDSAVVRDPDGNQVELVLSPVRDAR